MCLLTLTLCLLPFALFSSAYCFILPLVQAVIKKGRGGGITHTHNWLLSMQDGVS